MERGEPQPPTGDREEVVHSEREVVPTEVEERVEKLGTWSYAGAGLAVLAAILAIVALVVALGDGNGDREGADPREVERLQEEVRELSGALDEVRDQAAAGAEAEGRIDELSGSVSEIQGSISETAGGLDELSDRLDGLEQELSDLRSDVEAQDEEPPAGE